MADKSENINIEESSGVNPQLDLPDTGVESTSVENLKKEFAPAADSNLGQLMAPDEPQERIMDDVDDLEKVRIQTMIDHGMIRPDNVDVGIAGEVLKDKAQEAYAKRLLNIPVDPALEAKDIEQIQPLIPEVDLGVQKPVGADTVLESEEQLRNREILETLENNRIAEEAAEEAKRNYAREIAQEKAEVAKQQEVLKAEEQAKVSILAEDNKAEAEDPDGLSVRKTIAILLGGISQGLIGGQNPALVILDKLDEKRRKEREEKIKQGQLSRKEALAREKHELEMINKTLNSVKSKQSLVKGRLEIENLQAALSDKKTEIYNKQRLLELEQKGGLTAEQVKTLASDKDRLLYVRNPVDGSFYKVLNPETAKKLSNELADLETATNGLERLKEISQEFGNNWAKKLLDRSLRAEGAALRQSVVGNLRIALFGPGVLTEFEQKIAREIVNSGTDYFSLASANLASVDTILKKVNLSMRYKLQQAGANLGPSKNEEKIKKLQEAHFKATGKKMGIDKASSALIKAGMWEDEWR